MKTLLEEFGRPAWEFAWTYTGRSDAASSCLAEAFKRLGSARLPAAQPERRRAFWKILLAACRQQTSLSASASARGPESGDPRLAALLDLSLEFREALLLLRYHDASAQDLAEVLGCTPVEALGKAQRGLSRIALARAMPAP